MTMMSPFHHPQTTEKLQRRRYGRRRREQNATSTQHPPKMMMMMAKKRIKKRVVPKVLPPKTKDAAVKAAVEKDMEEEIFLSERETREKNTEKEVKDIKWKNTTDAERVEEFEVTPRLERDDERAGARLRFARMHLAEGSFVPSQKVFMKMNVAQHHGPFFDQCVKGNAFDLMMEYYGLFDPRDDQMDGGRIANAFISRMSREMRNGENNRSNFNASEYRLASKRGSTPNTETTTRFTLSL